MGPQMLEWISSKGLDALEALQKGFAIALSKGFAVALSARHDSHLGNLALVIWSKRLSLASLLNLS